MFKRRKMRLNGEWSLLAGNRVYELRKKLTTERAIKLKHSLCCTDLQLEKLNRFCPNTKWWTRDQFLVPTLYSKPDSACVLYAFDCTRKHIFSTFGQPKSSKNWLNKMVLRKNFNKNRHRIVWKVLPKYFVFFRVITPQLHCSKFSDNGYAVTA